MWMEDGTFVRVSATLKSSLNEFDDFTFALEYKNARDKLRNSSQWISICVAERNIVRRLYCAKRKLKPSCTLVEKKKQSNSELAA